MTRNINRTPIIAAILGLTVTLAATAPAGAQGNLRDVAQVRERLITAGIAVEIGDVCDSLDVRLLRGIAFLNGIKSYARSQGFSNAQIDAYTDDDVEKDRLEAIARARLAELGVVRGDAASHCAVGREQIALDTPIGRLLK